MPKSTCIDCVAAKAPEPNTAQRHERCHKHYEAAKASGVITPRKKRAAGSPPEECRVDDCHENKKANDLCASHNARAYRGAEIDAPFRGAVAELCSFSGCGRTGARGDLCAGHYAQKKSGKELTPLRVYIRREGECAVDDCDRDIENAGLCGGHYGRKVNGDPDWDQSLIKPKAANGEGHTDKNGYRVIYRDGKVMREHIAFAQDILGRKLTKNENVHHKNGNRSDNRTSGPFAMDERGRMLSGNLEVWSTAQPPGQEIGPKVEWALELLDLYLDVLRPSQRALLRDLTSRLDGDPPRGPSPVQAALQSIGAVADSEVMAELELADGAL